MRIAALTELTGSGAALAEAEAIFWESAGRKDFASAAERAAYRALWFARYAEHAPGEFLLALGGDGRVRGYLAGALVSDAPPLPGPDYYALFPAGLLARHPAHIHVNVHAGCRGGGTGAALVAAFGAHCRKEAVPGFHAVTAAGSRAAAFFGRCGLAPLAEEEWRGRPLVFLGARTTPR